MRNRQLWEGSGPQSARSQLVLTSLLVIVGLSGATLDGAAQALRKVCDPALGGALELTEDEVLAGRYPSVSGYSVSAGCAKALEARVKAWYTQDRNNWDRLSNQACSYALGWVERVPGTCQAGGPPPICPVDHWYRDPRQGKAQQEAERARVLGERARELERLACDCEGRAIWEAGRDMLLDDGAVAPPAAATAPSSGISLPCSGSCPIPGYNCVNGFCQLAAALTQPPSAGTRSFLLPHDTARLVEQTAKALEAINRPVLPVSGPFSLGRAITVPSPWMSSYQNTSGSLQSGLRTLGDALADAERALGQGLDPAAALKRATATRDQVRSSLNMLVQSAAEIQRQELIGYPACASVFEAEQGILAESAATILGRAISADAWPLQQRGWPLEYAYIVIDYTCGAKREPVRFISQVFGFCAPDIDTSRVIADNTLFFSQVRRVSCAAPALHVGTYVHREPTADAAEQARAAASRAARGRVVPWTASADVYVRACR